MCSGWLLFPVVWLDIWNPSAFQDKSHEKKTWKKGYVFWMRSKNLPVVLFGEIKNNSASALPEWGLVAWEKPQEEKENTL